MQVSALPAPVLVASLVAWACLVHGQGEGVAAQRAPEGARSPQPSRWSVVITTEAAPLQPGQLFEDAGRPGEASDVELDPAAIRQPVDGFGGAFNERGWASLSRSAPADQEAVLQALFAPGEGLDLRFGRVPIGASDYAVGRYSEDEVDGDLALEHFSIARDRWLLIPYLRAALRLRPDLELWASAWTPPSWMKTNRAFDRGAMRDEPEILDAYALYLARFVEAYRAEGIALRAVAVQNEPTVEADYPSCRWTPDQVRRFVRDHLGPRFQSRAVPAEIWLATLQDPNYADFPATVLGDPRALSYISAVGLQWGGLAIAPDLARDHPGLRLVETETECGNDPWAPGFDPRRAPNDWAYGVYTWRKIVAFLDAGARAYMLWNLVLDEVGRNLDAVLPWPQNAPVVVDSKTGAITYTPMFFAVLHLSRFVRPGAHLLSRRGAYEDAIAFANPDGSLVLAAYNGGAARTLRARIGEESVELVLPWRAFATAVRRAAR